MHKMFNFITSRGQFTGKTWHKIFLKQFLNYPWQYYRDNSIPDVSNVYKKSQKAESKFEGSLPLALKLEPI